MAVAFKSATAADGTFSATGATAWDAGMTVASGGAASAVIFLDSAGTAISASSGFTWGAATGQGLVMAAGTATGAGVAAMSLTRTNNNAAVDTGVLWTFTDGTSAAGFKPFQILGGAAGSTNLLSVSKVGAIVPGTDGTAAAPTYQVGVAGAQTLGIYRGDNTGLSLTDGTNPFVSFHPTYQVVCVQSGISYGWAASSTTANATLDTGVSRKAAGIVSFDTSTNGDGLASLHLSERTAPSAPAANGVYIYAVDNGAGKTQLMALFSSGAAQQIAIQP